MSEQLVIPDLVLEDPRACAGYFNNWYSNLPGGSRRRDYYDDMVDRPNSDPERRMGKTIRSFWGDIDGALVESGVRIGQVEGLVIRMNEALSRNLDYIREHRAAPTAADAAKSDDRLLELHRLTAPAFTRLREQGYTHFDLAG